MSIDLVNSWGSWGPILGIIIVGIMNKLDARKNDKLTREAKSIAERAVLASTKVGSDVLSARVVIDKVHVLTNNNMAVQLKLNAFTTRRLAALTKSEEDSKAALDAERLYTEHMSRQSAVNERSRNNP